MDRRYEIELLTDDIWSDRYLVFEQNGISFYLIGNATKENADRILFSDILRIHKAVSEDGTVFVLCVTHIDHTTKFIKFNTFDSYEECSNRLVRELYGDKGEMLGEGFQSDTIEVPEFISRDQSLWTNEQLDNLEELILRAVARDDDAMLAKLVTSPSCIIRTSARHQLSPIFVATKYNRVKSAKFFCKALGKMCVTVRDDINGWSCLHYAAANGCVEMVKIFLILGSDPLEETPSRINSIMLSIMNGRGNCLKLLLQSRPQFYETLTRTHQAALFKTSALLKRLSAADALVPFPDVCRSGFPTPLHFAAALARDDESIALLVTSDTVNAVDHIGFTPLFYAAIANRPNAIKYLAEHGANFDALDEKGRSVLQVAAMHGSAKAVKMIVECSPKTLSFRDAYGLTPLHYSLINGKVSASLALLDKDADLLACPRGTFFTPYLCAFLTRHANLIKDRISAPLIPQDVLNRCLFAAVASGDIEGVNLLLDAGADTNAKDCNGMTCLHVSVTASVVRELTRRNQSLVFSTNDKRLTPLHIAAKAGNSEVVKALAICGAPVGTLDAKGRTAIELAFKYSRESCANVLVEYETNIEKRYADDDTLLHKAAKHNFCRVLSTLIRKNCNLNAVDANGRTALHIAAFYGHQDFVVELLKAGVDRNVLDDFVMLPLFYAVFSGVVACASQLFPQNISEEPFDELIDNGNTLFHLFAKYLSTKPKKKHPLADYGEMTHLLLRKGYSPTELNDEGETPVHIIAEGTDGNALRVAMNEIDSNAADGHGKTLLHHAAQAGSSETVLVLLQNGAHPNALDTLGSTPFHYAVQANNEECLSVLIENGAGMSMKTRSGFSALHCAALAGAYKSVVFLCEHGANPNESGLHGNTPLHVACSACDLPWTASELIKAGADKAAKNNAGRSAADIAKDAGNENLYRLLTDPSYELPPLPDSEDCCEFSSLCAASSLTPTDQALEPPQQKAAASQKVGGWKITRPKEVIAQSGTAPLEQPQQQTGNSSTTQKRKWQIVKPSFK